MKPPIRPVYKRKKPAFNGAKILSGKRFPLKFGFVFSFLILLFIGVWHFTSGQLSSPPQPAVSGTTAYPKRVTLPQWQFTPGPFNAITDVPGVKVGHVTIQEDTPVTIRTGVTAIVPHEDDLALTGVWASGLMLHGNGELTGLHIIRDSGILNAPILLTNTFSVGSVSQGVFRYYLKHYPGTTRGSTSWPGQLPVVGECYDGIFNTIEDLSAVTPDDAVKAIETATGGPVLQGRTGAGTGMRSFELHAGIGSASRRLVIGEQTYMLGVLVNMNHSHFEHLNPVIRAKLEERFGKSLDKVKVEDKRDEIKRNAMPQSRQGSVMVVIATDMPLSPDQLEQLAKRAALGIGALGSTMDTTSGDGVIAFSTAQKVTLGDEAPSHLPMNVLHPDRLTPAYRATVEAVTEAQINALLASHSR